MPTVEERSIIRIGDSEGITLPKGWLKYNRNNGKLKNKKVELTIDDVITVRVLD